MLLQEIKKLCCDNANLIIVFGYDNATEQKQIEQLSLPELTPQHLDKLIQTYAGLGFKSLRYRYLSQGDLKNIPSTWAKKLAYGKKRQFVEIYTNVTANTLP